jgi:hypothetical protein
MAPVVALRLLQQGQTGDVYLGDPRLVWSMALLLSKGVAEEVHGLCGKLADVELICLVKTAPGHG